MGRLLTLLLLYRSGWVLGRSISLERLVEEARAGYYESLEASSQGWHEQYTTRCHGAVSSGVCCCGAIGNLSSASIPWLMREPKGMAVPRAEKRQLVREACQRQLVPFPVSAIEQECPGVSRELIRQVLQHLADEDLMELRGRGRAARWVPLSPQ